MTVFRAAAALAALLALPATAHAGTVAFDGVTMTYTSAAGGGDDVTLEGALFVASSQDVDGACTPVDPKRRSCPGVGAARVVLTAGTENIVNATQVTSTAGLTAVGSSTNDRLTGTRNADRLNGNEGSDNLIGGDGNDVLDGGPGENFHDDGGGDDAIVGGPQNDTLDAGPGRDTFTPGAGTDIVDYSARTGSVTITMGGGADDGEAGEGDDIGTDAEQAMGGSGNDTLVANNLGNELRGGAGNDTIRGGTAEDRLVGNEGDDTIDARDGRYDSIDCGPGNDVVLADPGDGTESCEVAPDRDGDGYLNEADCAPDNAAINPGAGEVIGNAVDEDCKAGPLYARVVSPVAYSVKRQASRDRMRFTKITVGEIKPGDRIELRCSTKARGCPFSRKTVTGKSKRTVSVLSHFKSRYLRRGAVVEIRTTRPNEIGSVRRLTVGRRGAVKSQALCLNVGATAPTRCA